MLTWLVNALISPRKWHVMTENVMCTMQSGGGGKLNNETNILAKTWNRKNNFTKYE